MAAMMLSASAVMTPTVRGVSSRRAASPGRVIARPVVRPSRGRGVMHRVRATVSKDNVFANSPGTLSGLGDITKAPLMSDDAATMPHRERLKVFSGSAHPELSDVRTNAPEREPDPRPRRRPRAPVHVLHRPSHATRAFARRHHAHFDGRAPRAQSLPGRARATPPRASDSNYIPAPLLRRRRRRRPFLLTPQPPDPNRTRRRSPTTSAWSLAVA